MKLVQQIFLGIGIAIVQGSSQWLFVFTGVFMNFKTQNVLKSPVILIGSCASLAVLIIACGRGNAPHTEADFQLKNKCNVAESNGRGFDATELHARRKNILGERNVMVLTYVQKDANGRMIGVKGAQAAPAKPAAQPAASGQALPQGAVSESDALDREISALEASTALSAFKTTTLTMNRKLTPPVATTNSQAPADEKSVAPAAAQSNELAQFVNGPSQISYNHDCGTLEGKVLSPLSSRALAYKLKGIGTHFIEMEVTDESGDSATLKIQEVMPDGSDISERFEADGTLKDIAAYKDRVASGFSTIKMELKNETTKDEVVVMQVTDLDTVQNNKIKLDKSVYEHVNKALKAFALPEIKAEEETDGHKYTGVVLQRLNSAYYKMVGCAGAKTPEDQAKLCPQPVQPTGEIAPAQTGAPAAGGGAAPAPAPAPAGGAAT
jgi:hypothetical protein